MHDSYAARESETVSVVPDRSRTTVQSLRKRRTLIFNPLNADGFDLVIELAVQFALYLKLS